MSSKFNFQRAWREVASPAYADLPEEIIELHERVKLTCGDLTQAEHTLLLPFPDEGLEKAFKAIEPRQLAVATRVINGWGTWSHTGLARVSLRGRVVNVIIADDFDCWSPRNEAEKYVKQRLADPWLSPEEFEIAYVKYGDNAGGSGWKFANLADQVLNKYMGVDPSKHASPSWKAYEGQLRHHMSNSRGWTNADVGWATIEEMQRAQELWAELRDDDQLMREMIKDYPTREQAWFTLSRDFMDHEPGTDYDHSELPRLFQRYVEEEFTVTHVSAVNFRVDYSNTGGSHIKRGVENDHPFTIGAKHLQEAHGGMLSLDSSSAVCDACGEPYDHHTHDLALFLECRKNLTQEEANQALQRIKELAEEHGIEGFAFPPSPEGFTIEGVHDAVS